MSYEVWDRTTANMIEEFDTADELREWALSLLANQGTEAFQDLSIGGEGLAKGVPALVFVAMASMATLLFERAHLFGPVRADLVEAALAAAPSMTGAPSPNALADIVMRLHRTLIPAVSILQPTWKPQGEARVRRGSAGQPQPVALLGGSGLSPALES